MIGTSATLELPNYTECSQFMLLKYYITTAPWCTAALSSLIDKKLLLKQLTTINPDKAAGPDDIKPKDFCIAGEALADSLYNVLSKSKETRQVPQKWKKGKLKAVYKKGTQCSVQITDP